MSTAATAIDGMGRGQAFSLCVTYEWRKSDSPLTARAEVANNLRIFAFFESVWLISGTKMRIPFMNMPDGHTVFIRNSNQNFLHFPYYSKRKENLPVKRKSKNFNRT